MARNNDEGTVATPEPAVATFETLVQEEQSLKERMQARLNEITPQVEEAEKIQAWLAEHTAAMSDNGAQPQAQAPAASSARKRGGQRRRQSSGRIPRGGAREAFLNVVREHPQGITVADVAKALGKPPAYYYRIASDAEKAGQVVRTDDGVKIA